MGLETIRLYEIIIRGLFSLITTMLHNNSGSKQLWHQKLALAMACQAEKFRIAMPHGFELAAGSSLK
jgi:hypothetical protein